MLETTNGLTKLVHLGARGGVHIGLVGRGIAASLSPVMHRREGERLGLDYHYHLIDFDALGLGDDALGDVLGVLQDIGFKGVNVTHPFKQAVVPLLDSLDPGARAIGAVNTVLFRDARRIGHNTDCWGFAESFRCGLADAARGHVLQIGAGGAGAAVGQALIDLGVSELSIFDVDGARAEALARRLAKSGRPVCPVSDLVPVGSRVDGLVNATPIGMEKYPGTPFDTALLTPTQWVADIVYFPRITRLIAEARDKGCPTLPGAGMAIYQAVKAFELFTGQAPSSEDMAKTFEAAA